MPNEIGQLTNLVELYLSGNHIEKVTEQVLNLQRLEVLSFEDNKELTTLPHNLSSLPYLRLIDLTNTQITERTLPIDIKNDNTLEILF